MVDSNAFGIWELAAGRFVCLGYFGVWFAGLLRHIAGGKVLRGRDLVLWRYFCGVVPVGLLTRVPVAKYSTNFVRSFSGPTVIAVNCE